MSIAAPRREDSVLRYILERNAAENPDEIFASFEGGETWTREQTVHEAYRSANALRAMGVGQGDRVGLMLRNGPDFLRAWFGAHSLGASLVSINLSYKQTMINHVIATSPVVALVHEPDFADLLGTTDFDGILLTVDQLQSSDLTPPELARPIEPWDVHLTGYTSGTTGPSKGSLTANIQVLTQGNVINEVWGLGESDTFLIDLPMFHTAAQAAVFASAGSRTRIAVRTRPAMSTYWTVARETGATAAILVSTMAAFLEKQPFHEDERRHNLRLVMSGPQPKDPEGFVSRFGIENLTTCWASTESSAAITHKPDAGPLPPTSCGRARDGYQLRIVDEHDNEVPHGQPGELIVRTDAPWIQSGGYIGLPEATAAAWRNGWYHTGDVLIEDEAGFFYFHDRVKDALRRRGENISSFEVERDVLGHPDVADVACIGVPSDHETDDEVMIFVVLKPGAEMDFPAFGADLVERMPRFMVPRYVEVVAELPRTATMRVQKNILREIGVSPSTWDREASSLVQSKT